MNNINDAMKKLQESRDRVAETLPKFIYDLGYVITTKKEITIKFIIQLLVNLI